MAELHVQKKEQSIWPWVLAALIILALLLWFLLGRGDNRDATAASMTDSTMVGSAPATDADRSATGNATGNAVAGYLQYVDNRGARAASPSHEHTADGLRQLAAALDELTTGDQDGGVSVQPRIDEIRERADAMQRNPTSTEHALQAREAFAIAASLIGQMRNNASAGTANASGGDQNALQEAAMAIAPSRPLLDQMEQIEQFFGRAGDAVRNMNGST